MPRLSLAELSRQLGGDVQGDPAASVEAAASLASATEQSLSFAVGPAYLEEARQSRAAVLILPHALADALPGRAALRVRNPHAVFARAVALLHPPVETAAGIHPGAFVAADARIGAGARIGPGAVIETGARIGDGCMIEAQAHVGAFAELGPDCHLHARASVRARCVLGARVILQGGCVIGSDGFGLAWESDDAGGGRWLKVPHVGRVVLGDDVEIGANTTVDRGALDDTVIETGAKLDNLIQIAHNCRIGAHTAIAGCVGIAGSTKIGAYCQIGGAAMLIGHLVIGDRVTISAGTFVAKDIRAPGVYTSVQPLMTHEQWKRNAAHLRHLDALAARLKTLEKRWPPVAAHAD